jgi:hypothetical protein
VVLLSVVPCNTPRGSPRRLLAVPAFIPMKPAVVGAPDQPGGRPGGLDRQAADSEKRLVTSLRSDTPLGFLGTVVCKRLADWEINFRKSGYANTQIIHSNGVTEYSRGNEIAIE